MSERLCRWKCTRRTNRRCGICLQCCDERDEHNKRIDAGTAKYIPPTERPGHRFYVSSERKAARLVRGAKAKATRTANIHLKPWGRRYFRDVNSRFLT